MKKLLLASLVILFMGGCKERKNVYLIEQIIHYKGNAKEGKYFHNATKKSRTIHFDSIECNEDRYFVKYDSALSANTGINSIEFNIINIETK